MKKPVFLCGLLFTILILSGLSETRIFDSLVSKKSSDPFLLEWADADGNLQKPASLEQFLNSQKTILIFWASWCSECLLSISKNNLMAEKAKKEGWQVLAVHAQNGAREGFRIAKEKGLRVPVLLDKQGRIFSQYGVVTLPSVIVLEKGGKIIYFGLRFPDWLEGKQ